ncbi:Prolow-density lipoprotein receptor-related protein 1 [Nymphon striatum]|nr:Prolow-density lipoprotein receptor-related protein 1 [Nymphon striatum]
MHHSSLCQIFPILPLSKILLVLLFQANHAVLTADSNTNAENSLQRTCAPNQFQCDETKICLPLKLICDGKVDCKNSTLNDDSDETNPRCKMFNVCPNNYFACRDNITCIPLYHVCDNRYDCPEMTDEGSFCYADECLIEGSCDQFCENTEGSHKCSCADGYELIDERKCRAIKINSTDRIEDPIILLMSRNSIRRLYMNETIILGINYVTDSSITAFDFDHKLQKVFWVARTSADTNLQQANITSLNQVDKSLPSLHLILAEDQIYKCVRTLVEQDVSGKPKDLALDPTVGFIFLTFPDPKSPRIERRNIDGTRRISVATDLVLKPHLVTLDLVKKQVFWTDAELSIIAYVDYDGSHRPYIVTKNEIVSLLTGFVLFEQYIYAVSSAQILHKINRYNPTNDVTIMKKSRHNSTDIRIFHRLLQPPAVSSDKQLGEVCNNNNGGCNHICIPVSNGREIFGKCICSSGYRLNPNSKKCEEDEFLIFIQKEPPVIRGTSLTLTQDFGVIPSIASHYKPKLFDYDAEGKFIYYYGVFKDQNVVVQQSLDGFSRNVVVDKGLKSVTGFAIDWLGNNIYILNQGVGSIACIRLSSQEKIRKTVLLPNAAKRTNLVISPLNGKLFWIESFKNSSQNTQTSIMTMDMDLTNLEVFVQDSSLSNITALTLDSSGNVLYWYNMDHKLFEKINIDGTDRKAVYQDTKSRSLVELAVHENKLFWADLENNIIYALRLNHSKKGAYDFQYVPGGILALKLFNNVTRNDKEQSNDSCGHEFFKCLNGEGCVNYRFLCDGDKDCSDGSDEDGSINGLCSNITCPEDTHQCGTTRLCILENMLCDGDPDCPGMEDENPAICRANTPCELTEFTCADGFCLELHLFCDGVEDCYDGSDEYNCPEINCNSTAFFKCDSKHKCVRKDLECNGVIDCEDGSDEKNCSKSIRLKSKCHDDEFVCSDGRCIPQVFKCDLKKDCWDGSDELDCKSINCPDFLCADGKNCIPEFDKCDGFKDCEDNSDENNCPEPKPKCNYPDRSCDEGKKCVKVTQLCDRTEDCVDGSDEGEDCSNFKCFNSECNSMCQSTPEGHICYCAENQTLSLDKKTCLDAHPCDIWGTCSQKCKQFKFVHKCQCEPGYKLEPDHFTCKSIALKPGEGHAQVTANMIIFEVLYPAVPYIIFSNRHELRSVDLRTMSVKILLAGLKNTIAVDFYHSNDGDIIYWTDVVDDKIYRAAMVNRTIRNIEVVVQRGLATAEGLAVDWIGENLYWVESSLDQIEVAKLNGSFRKTLIAGDMESPRAIALDPRYGVLFWSDWDHGAPRIEQASMSGEGRKVVFRVDSVADGAWPNGLTLDFVAHRIYWIDAKSDAIHSTKYDGTGHQQILQGHFFLSHPFAISLFENYIYWTDWRTNSVNRANKWNGSDVDNVERTSTQPFDIQIVHPSRQPREDERVLLFSRPNVIRGVDLQQPYYHVIPPLSQPQVADASQIDFDAKSKKIYWSDTQRNEIKRSALTGVLIETVLDTVIENPYGFGIDWMSGNMFLTSYNLTYGSIYVCNLEGEYIKRIINIKDMMPRSLAIHPILGKIIWADHNTPAQKIVMANMDGSGLQVLISTHEDANLDSPTSLSIDFENNYLYWINGKENKTIQKMALRVNSQNRPETLVFADEMSSEPLAITVYKDILIYATDSNNLLHSVSKVNLKGHRVLRNNTADVMALKVYDESLQTGTNLCSENKGNCSHLCLPMFGSKRVCVCASGYHIDPMDQTKCIGSDKFLLYSINWEIFGIPLDPKDTTEMLAPISRVLMATAIDFDAENDYIYWVDDDEGSINRIKRDGTGREIIISGLESVEGIAIDWVAGNIYWVNPIYDVIEVAHLNGSYKYVLISEELDKPKAIVVNPASGYLFWSDWGMPPKIERATLDGKNRKVLVNTTIQFVVDLAIDEEDNKLYWCDQRTDRIERINFDGTNREVVIQGGEPGDNPHSAIIENPLALTVYKEYIYYTDSTYQRGSVIRVNKNDVSDFYTMRKHQGDSLKDIVVFHHDRKKNLNPCGTNNGGCEELCFYIGNNSVSCACAHGTLNDDQKTCKEYDAFLIYSLVLKISSIHLIDDKNLNSPFPDIADRNKMRNVIGLAFDYDKKRIFYSDIQNGYIANALVEGLAYDPVYRVLYWTSNRDASISRLSMLFKLHEPRNEKLVQLSSDDKPRGIAVDGCQGSHLTGHDVRSIVTSDIVMPNALTVDHQTQKLYWSDARLDKIERCNMNGAERYILLKNAPKHPFDIAVYGDFIFWSDWVRHAVLRANKYTGEDVTVLRENIPRIMGIAAVANNSQDCTLNPCLSTELNCEDMCDVLPNGTPFCQCVRGRKLDPDGKHCIANASSCSPDEFQCGAGQCIPYHLTCDDIAECPDETDEEKDYCKIRKCNDGYFQCKNNRCIPNSLVCDQRNNCGDHSDELNCSCLPEQFRCKSGICIDRTYRCDSDRDCPDASDEMDCGPRNCGTHPILSEELQLLIPCNTTTACIHKEWLCDGQDDCWDNSDEQNCTKTPTLICPTNYFRCRNGQCIPQSWRCDHQEDCLGELDNDVTSDEGNCTYICDENQFKCSNDECIPLVSRCDGNKDCSDGSDEMDDCKIKSDGSCPKNEVKCESTGLCIPETWMCDGDNDCDGEIAEDEHPDKGCVGIICEPGEFQCANLQCILQIFYCDRENDCGDNSDEPASCVYHECSEEEFECGNKRCIPKDWVCNGLTDCSDRSDEANCAKNKTRCKKDQFECKNHDCVANTTLCNGENDCGDFSDEESCHINECDTAIPYCSQICIDKLIGFECSCDEGFHLIDDRMCKDIDECVETYPCSHNCRNTYGSYACSCADGYISFDSGHTCRANTDVKPKLLFSNRYYIREVSVFGNQSTHLLAQNLTNAVALDFDWQTKCIYWSEITTLGSSIKRMCEGISGYQVIHDATVRQPVGIAIDWIGRNLYWCDKGRDTIEVSKLDGKFRRVLINERLDEPRAIVVDPQEGYMYWTDWGEKAYVGKAGMDGSNPRVIVNDSLGWPNALTISYVTRELFWADARRDYIAVTDLEGRNKRIVRSRDSQLLHHIFSLTVFEDYLYWTDWETKSVERCHKYTGENHQTIAKTIHRPMDLQIYHPNKQPPLKGENPCLLNGNCSTLCLLSPGLNKTCVCPENFFLHSDKKSCSSNCSSSHIVCEKTYKCISFWWKCDTQDDCGDGSDEPPTCPTFNCIPGQFQCADGESCIHPSQICDGVAQCTDGSDERNCQNHACLPSQYKCSGGEKSPSRCIQLSHKCDGYADCIEKDDEMNCAPKTCKANEMRCNNSICIPNVFMCDGDDDCGDNSDEPVSCAVRSCSEDEFRCNSGRCIPNSWFCDGDLDCGEWEDEPKSCADHTCDPSYFLCNNTRCIPGRWKCDFDDDCGDKSDELNCVPRNCSESEFRCASGRCIRGSLHCNGEYNCEDLSDELQCNITCDANHFKCHNPPFCILKEWQCDRDADCADGSDEEGCGHTCKRGEFQCKDKHCISYQWHCDGQLDCPDGSDEDNELCKSRVCEPGRSLCANHRCIPQSQFCDGIDNCGDNSDEDNNYCKAYHKGCSDSNLFQCKNGRCIAQTYVCDKYDDCTDGSDEEHCDECKFRTCSQLCFVKNSQNYTCGCANGYKSDWSKSGCSAKGDSAVLMIASDNELRQLNPYKPQAEGTEKLLSNILENKTRLAFVDIIYTPEYSIAFWTDYHLKAIIRYNIVNPRSSRRGKKNENKRVKRQEQLNAIITGLNDPRGIACDWVANRLYWTDAGNDTISVATLDGNWQRTLIKTGLDQPYDIAVDPEFGNIYWTDWGIQPKIETAHMDGSNRRILIASNVVWPTGLTIDYAAHNLYWADPKLGTIKVISLQHELEENVYTFPKDGDKPNRIEIFEDYLYITTYKTNNIMKMHKFGRQEPVYLVKGLNRASDIVIVQEHKHTVNLTNPCRRKQHTCGYKAECVIISSTEGSCLCPDGFIEDPTDKTSQMRCTKYAATKSKKCAKVCYNNGNCYFNEKGKPMCNCTSGFTGDQCDEYRCSNYCKNHGYCSTEKNPKDPDGPPLLKCRCPAQFIGERCEKPSNLCDNYCQNQGVCHVFYGVPQCICVKGFTGKRCEVCTNLKCQNNSPCKAEKNGVLTCVCPVGYTGKLCEKSTCDGYCYHDSLCEASVNGVPSCKCRTGFSGERCEKDLCQGLCYNGGTCIRNKGGLACACPNSYTGKQCLHRVNKLVNLCKCLNGGQCYTIQHGKNVYNPDGSAIFCSCPPGFTGNFCEQMTAKSCADIKCMHNGICGMVNGIPRCKCSSEYQGIICEKVLSENSCDGYCQNRGVCSHLDSHRNKPFCTCTLEWTGPMCEIKTLCHNVCYNGATCIPSLNENEKPTCLCADGYTGAHCHESTASSCNGYCLHGGTCIYSGSINHAPFCKCVEGWAGNRCESRTSCKGFCFNGATCNPPLDDDEKPTCLCQQGFYGLRCENSNLQPQSSESSNSGGTYINYTFLAISLTVIFVVILIIAVILYVFCKRRNRAPFMHIRMQDNSNVEINNPMYLREEYDDNIGELDSTFSLNPDKPTNVQNPLYNSLFEDEPHNISGGSEEKKGLLQHDRLKVDFSSGEGGGVSDAKTDILA